MTEKLFENNALLKSCQAIVLACTEAKGEYLVELDKTVFFPEGGGQLSDRGTLGNVKVKHVSEKEGHIYHHCEAALEVGSAVEAKLDWLVRLDRMQQHCGEHILSYACWKLFQANNVGFRMNEDSVTIDLDKELTEEELLQAEHLTNEIIWENRPIHIDYMDSTEAVQLKDKMRKYNDKLTGLLRIVSVEDADVCTCCGTHPPFTGMVGSVKLVRNDKHKQGIRVEFLCGRRALLDADKKYSTLLGVAQSLSSKPEQVPDYLAKLKKDMQDLKEELNKKTMQLLESELAEKLAKATVKTDGTKLVILPIEGGDGKEAKLLLPKLGAMPKTLSLIFSILPQRINYAITVGPDTKANCQPIIKLVNTVFEGRGGGKPDCAQGGGSFCADWQERLAKLEAELLKE